jgi:hypothetical protein
MLAILRFQYLRAFYYRLAVSHRLRQVRTADAAIKAGKRKVITAACVGRLQHYASANLNSCICHY